MADLNSQDYSIQLKKGLFANINTTVTKNLAVNGELHWATDTEELYIFNGTTNIKIGEANKPISTKTADYTLTINDYTILLDGTSNTVTATLPTAVGNTGRIYFIKCIDDTFTTDIATNGAEEIDGDNANIELINMETIALQSDGANWWII